MLSSLYVRFLEEKMYQKKLGGLENLLSVTNEASRKVVQVCSSRSFKA